MSEGLAGDGKPARDDTSVRVLEKVARLDPLLVEAADDVDVGLIRWSLSQTPRERLRSCSRMAATLARLSLGSPAGR